MFDLKVNIGWAKLNTLSISLLNFPDRPQNIVGFHNICKYPWQLKCLDLSNFAFNIENMHLSKRGIKVIR